MKGRISFIFIALTAWPCWAAPSTSIPFQLHRGYLILTKCSVAGKAGLTAIVDTGTTETILDLKLAHRLGLDNWPESATSLTKDAPARGVRITDLRFGPISIPTLDGVGMDLSAITQELGTRLDLIVGMDVLRQTSLTIDYGMHTIEFGPPIPMAHGAALAPDPGFRFALIDSEVLGRRLRLQVDTGFNGMLVYRDRLVGLAMPATVDARVAGVAQTSGVRSVDSPRVRLGNWLGEHLSVAVMDGSPSGFSVFDGLFGPSFLGAKRLAFDFEHRMLYWD